MKKSDERWVVASPYGAHGPVDLLRDSRSPFWIESIRLSLFRSICQVGASFEAATLLPLTAIIILPGLLYLLITRGYYKVLYTSNESR